MVIPRDRDAETRIYLAAAIPTALIIINEVIIVVALYIYLKKQAANAIAISEEVDESTCRTSTAN